MCSNMNKLKYFVSFLLCFSYCNGQVDKQHIKYHFYSKENPQAPNIIDRNNFFQANLSKTEETKIILHGFTEDATASWAMEIKNNYLKIGTKNVVSLDWGRYAKRSYFYIKDQVEELATAIAEDMFDLANANDIKIEMFHLVAFSFSAHIVGLAGKIINKNTDQKLGRISALDPAGPFFNGESPERRLNKNDAKFVDIIHTFVITGYFDSTGDIDFWPNGGLFQLGCVLMSACSHVRAALYFAESIISNNFTARYCLSYAVYNSGICNFNKQAIMGEHVDRTMKGNYFLYTNSRSPYACKC